MENITHCVNALTFLVLLEPIKLSVEHQHVNTISCGHSNTENTLTTSESCLAPGDPDEVLYKCDNMPEKTIV